MKLQHLLIAVIVLASAQFAALMWVENSLSRRIDALDSAIATQTTEPSSVSKQPASSVETADAAPAMADAGSVEVAEITYDLFNAQWKKHDNRAALRACWKTADSTQLLHFRLKVNADGEITDAQAEELRPGSVPSELSACVGALVKKVRFAPTGTPRAGRVQVDRPAD